VAKNYGEEMKRQNSKVTDHFDTSMKGVFSKLKVGWVALAGIVASVLTSPFNEVDDKINELLNQTDNTVTRANQWGVDPARYMAFQKVAGVYGVDEGMADNLLNRIADRLDQARTGEDPTLKKYLGAGDIIDVAHSLFRTWNEMSPLERAGSMNDIVGIRQAGAFAELVQADWNSTANKIQGGRNINTIGSRLTKLSDLEQIQKENRAKQSYDFLMSASGMISDSTIANQDKVERQKQQNMLNNIARYNSLASTEVTLQQAKGLLEDIKGGVYDVVDGVRRLSGMDGKVAQKQEIQKIKIESKQGVKKASETLKGTPRQQAGMKKLGLEGLM
jgi:hypothetical protein